MCDRMDLQLAGRRVMSAALALALAIGMLAMSGAAATTRTPSGDGAARTAQLGGCQADAADDVSDLDTGDPVTQPHADLIEHCLRFGPTVSVSSEVAQPTRPEQDANWRYGTFAGWYLDTDGDGDGDYFVDFSLDAQSAELTGLVRNIPSDGEPGAVVCDARATVAQGVYHVSGIEPSCLGGADSAAVNAAVFYDTTEGGTSGTVAVDTHPPDGAFTPAQTSTARTSARLGGRGRIDTAVEISQRQFPSQGDAERVYLSRADVFADSTVGGTVPDGPILLTTRTGPAPRAVRDEIDRLDPDEVVAFGGTAAVSEQTLSSAAGGRPTARYAGTGRIETAVAISQNVFPGGADEVYLARADLFADAVAGGSLSDGPILLVPRTGAVPQTVLDEIERVDPQRVLALGGTAAVSPGVLSAAAQGRPTERLAGAGRMQTAAEIARYEFPRATQDAFLARADVFADAVVGGTLTAGPTLLVPSSGQLPSTVSGEISRMSPPQVTALGGTAAVSSGILQQAAQS